MFMGPSHPKSKPVNGASSSQQTTYHRVSDIHTVESRVDCEASEEENVGNTRFRSSSTSSKLFSTKDNRTVPEMNKNSGNERNNVLSPLRSSNYLSQARKLSSRSTENQNRDQPERNYSSLLPVSGTTSSPVSTSMEVQFHQQRNGIVKGTVTNQISEFNQDRKLENYQPNQRKQNSMIQTEPHTSLGVPLRQQRVETIQYAERKQSDYPRKETDQAPSQEKHYQQMPLMPSKASNLKARETVKTGRGDKAGDESSTSVTIEEVRKGPDGRISIHRYLRGRLLGKGGFAKVYMCTSLDTQKSYAIKIVPKANLVKTRARQKLQAEIKIHRTLKHSYICDYKHFFEDRTNCYILLELCENQSMNELIKRRKRLTEAEVRYFFRQLVDGTMYMHSNNVIHRDLKLGNLFLNRKLEIKIGDLGLATKLSSSEDRRKTICGTPNYIAPEIIDGNKEGNGHSFEVDIWSMGVILFTLLVGKPPYESKDVKSTYKRILKNQYSFPSHVHVSQHAKDLINAMLQTKPELRPSLEAVQNHPFFTESKIPQMLPSRCAHLEPIWHENPNGQMLARFNNESSALNFRKKANDGMQQQRHQQQQGERQHRQPLSIRDQNQLQNQNQVNSRGIKDFKKNAAVSKPPTTTAVSKPPLNKPVHLESGGIQTKRDREKAVKFNVYSDPVASRQEDEKEGEISNGGDSKQVLKPDEVKIPIPSETAVDELKTKASVMSIGDTVGGPQNSQLPKPEHETSSKGQASVCKQDKESNFDSEQEPVVTPTHVPQKPSAQKPSANSVVDRDTHSLEVMHMRLTECLAQTETQMNPGKLSSAHQDISVNSMQEGTKWVTRYVDYTSKYGLGFLLNDGSAGVYFNDSTKAVLAPDGETFHYVERRRVPKADSTEPHPTFEVYSLSKFPDSLQKKVTLLKHFCGYLLEQEKKSDTDSTPPRENKLSNVGDSDSPFVFLKKWVRTRHAILFRMSNSTVQVVFFDHSEILLSSEAKFITYVDKARKRSTFPLEKMAMEATAEMSKRLRYARDILQQLISGSKSS